MLSGFLQQKRLDAFSDLKRKKVRLLIEISYRQNGIL